MSLARSLAGSTLAVALAGGVTRALSLASAPILTALLSPEAYGVAALLGTVTSLATIVSLAGIDMAYARFFFGGGRAGGEGAERFCWRFSIVGGGIVGCVVASAGALWGPSSLGIDRPLWLAAGGAVVLSVVSTMAQTRQRIRASYRRLGVAIATAGGVSVAITIIAAAYWRRDAWPLVLGSLSTPAFIIVLLGIPGIGELGNPSGLSRVDRWDLARFGMAGAITAPAYWLISSADRWFIAAAQGHAAVGVYSIAVSVGTVGLLANSALVTTWFPEVTRSYEARGKGALEEIGRLWERTVVGLMFVWLAVAGVGGDMIRVLTPESFHRAISYVPWLAAATFFYGVAQLANTGLVLAGTMKPAAHVWIAGGGLSVLLNAGLVPRWGLAGAAVAQVVTYVFLATIAMVAAQQRCALRVSWTRLATRGAAIIAVGILLSQDFGTSAAVALSAKAAIYVCCGLYAARRLIPDWRKLLVNGRVLARFR